MSYELFDKGLVNGKLFFFQKKIIFRLLNLRTNLRTKHFMLLIKIF